VEVRPDQLRAVQEAYGAFARGDFEAVLERLSDRVTWDATDALWVTGTFFGHAGVRDYFDQVEESWEGLRLQDYDLEVVRPGLLLVRGRLRGRDRATGVAADAPFVHWVEVDLDAKITRLRILVDPDRPR
jgi:ketosteroid isomerase-like protein